MCYNLSSNVTNITNKNELYEGEDINPHNIEGEREQFMQVMDLIWLRLNEEQHDIEVVHEAREQMETPQTIVSDNYLLIREFVDEMINM
jgi:hypothetical protein